jgi:hypothetical protein
MYHIASSRALRSGGSPDLVNSDLVGPARAGNLLTKAGPVYAICVIGLMGSGFALVILVNPFVGAIPLAAWAVMVLRQPGIRVEDFKVAPSREPWLSPERRHVFLFRSLAGFSVLVFSSIVLFLLVAIITL